MRLAVTTLLLAAWACAPLPAPDAAPAAEPELPRHELIFAHHADDARKDYDVWRVCADGTQFASLVVEPGHQFQLAVSPDGNEFLYTSRFDGVGEIWRKPFGRGEPVNLTNHPADDSGPAWSPDGGRVAFFSDRDAAKPELYLLHLDDGKLERLTDNAYHDSGATWSPDGTAIAWTRFFPAGEGYDGAGEILRLDLADRGETQLTDLGGYNGGVDWSPDGSTLAFHRSGDGGVEIWLVDADGRNPRALTDTPIDEYSPAWSPDGHWIAYSAGKSSDNYGRFDLWLMRADGSGRRPITDAPNTEAWQVWRPGERTCR